MTFFPKCFRPKPPTECIDLISDNEDDITKISNNLKILEKYLQDDLKNISTDSIPPALIEEWKGTELKYSPKEEDVQVVELPSSSTCATVAEVLSDEDEILEDAIKSIRRNDCDYAENRTSIPRTHLCLPMRSQLRRKNKSRVNRPVRVQKTKKNTVRHKWKRNGQSRRNAKRIRHKESMHTHIRGKDEINEGLQVAIVNANNPDHPLTDKQWTHVETFLLDCLHEALMNSTTKPFFGQLSSDRGFRILACQDTVTLKWLLDTIQTFRVPWYGIVLKVVKRSELPTRPRARIHIPGPLITKSRLEHFLRGLNPEFPSHDWIVLEMEEPDETGQEAVIMLNHQSMVMLPSMRFKVRIGLNTVKVRPIRERGGSFAAPNGSADGEDCLDDVEFRD